MPHLSALGRSIAPWHPATAWALFASTIVFVTAGISHGFSSGLRGAVAVFLTWAIVRELAPKRFLASLLAPFAGVAFAIPADTVLLASVATLLAARIASRTVGDPPTPLDRVLLVAGAGWLAMWSVGVPAALVLGAVCFSDEHRLRARVTGVGILVAVLAVGSIEGTLTLRPEWTAPPLQGQVLLAFAAASTVWLLLAPLPARLRVRSDRRRGQLRSARVRTARVATLACVGAAVAWTGTDGVFALAPASAALLAAGIGGARLPAARD